MTIVASGEISLGGNATATRSVACELFRSGTAAICMDESDVRTLAARTTAASAICMNNFYSKSNAPTALGEFKTGGYYTGVSYNNCCAYYLFIAPNATGCANCQWKTTRTLTGNNSNSDCNLNNGYWNTFTYLNNADHPAGNFAATRTIGGFSDWFLPATNELNVLYTNKGSMPAGEGYALANYWSSTERDTNYVCIEDLNIGNITYQFKRTISSGYRVRAVRRSSFTPSEPTAIGQCYGGGIYGGTVYTGCCGYYLIVAPNALGCACCQWKTTRTLTGNCSTPDCNDNNGYWNTFTCLNNADHPAGNYAATRTIAGFTDWYLPAKNELNVLCSNKASFPTGEGFDPNQYWSSTEHTSGFVCYINFGGGFGSNYKYRTCRVRATRRSNFTPSPTALGQYVWGGYYLGTISSPGNYYLIVAPNATGCANCKWKTFADLTDNCSNSNCNFNNGYWNTYTYLNNTTHPAGNFAATRTIGGFTDWYLPSHNEMSVLYTNKGSMPTGETFTNGRYWSSTEFCCKYSYQTDFTQGNVFNNGCKSYNSPTRAIRRQPF